MLTMDGWVLVRKCQSFEHACRVARKMKTKHDRLVSELCDEIDTLEAENEALTGKYEELSRKYSKLLDDTLKGCERTTGAIIGLTLAGKLKL